MGDLIEKLLSLDGRHGHNLTESVEGLGEIVGLLGDQRQMKSRAFFAKMVPFRQK